MAVAVQVSPAFWLSQVLLSYEMARRNPHYWNNLAVRQLTKAVLRPKYDPQLLLAYRKDRVDL